MKKWFFGWLRDGIRAINTEEGNAVRAEGLRFSGQNFEGGMTFQLIEAQNGKILKVMVPSSKANQSSSFNFNPHSGMEEKLYVIPDGEDVMAFITRALVEERIK